MDDFSIVESGQSSEPVYDESTNRMHDPDLDSGKGGWREPTIHEQVRAEYLKAKAKVDPVERYRQTAEKNGRSLGSVLETISEFDRASKNGQDPTAGARWYINKYNLDPQAVGSDLYYNTSPEGRAQTALQTHTNSVINDFWQENAHRPQWLEGLRMGASKIINSGDERLGETRGISDREILYRAFSLAEQDYHSGRSKVAHPVERLAARDRAREQAKSIGTNVVKLMDRRHGR